MYGSFVLLPGELLDDLDRCINEIKAHLKNCKERLQNNLRNKIKKAKHGFFMFSRSTKLYAHGTFFKYLHSPRSKERCYQIHRSNVDIAVFSTTPLVIP